jgi:hypothetical protein
MWQVKNVLVGVVGKWVGMLLLLLLLDGHLLYKPSPYTDKGSSTI